MRKTIGCAALLFLWGCAEPVREDRSVEWSSQGDSVGFQHREDGVFIADQKGKLQKIHQPGAKVSASSTPLWSPTDGRLIFTTAVPRDGHRAWPLLAGDNPEGALFVRQPVTYTCWLREAVGGEAPPTPVALFEAECAHVGFVAANLAVRWHPDGGSILHVREVDKGRHGLFAFDLATGATHCVLPHTADALLFDWSPDGRWLACLLADEEPAKTDGIWIGRPGADDWRQLRVPRRRLARNEEPGPLEQLLLEQISVLEELRAGRPAWTPDGKSFAYTSAKPDRHRILVHTPSTRRTVLLAQARERFRDLHWAPDGMRLGAVRGDALYLIAPDGRLSAPVNARPVRRFVGWNATGDRLAYTVPDRIPLQPKELWALLLVPDPLARDAVFVTDGEGKTPGREVFAGMRVTFPQWSPKDDRLSLWFTFSPTHRTVLSRLFGWGLRPGDPAALFDSASGQITWLTVNAHEKAQVGHYHLLRREYAKAWTWYEQAEREAPEQPAPPRQRWFENLFGFNQPRDAHFFQYFCLKQLGREKEARFKLEAFERSLRGDEPRGQAETLGFFRDLYVAEVFLSLDAADACEAYFRPEHEDGGPRVGPALVTSQLHLLRERRAAYARHATETLAPLLLAELGSVDVITGAALLPLFSPEFLAGLKAEQVVTLAAGWEKLRGTAASDAASLAADLVLRAAYHRLGRIEEERAASRRIAQRPQESVFLMVRPDDIEESVQRIRRLLTRPWRW
ncbi:MAG: TolB family protein [Planctomycetota bacterium]|jgi:hypothetical protein